MADLMKGKRGLVMGVANDTSIAWGIAQALAAEGAKLAFSYQGEAFGKRVEPLAAGRVATSGRCDVTEMPPEPFLAIRGHAGARWISLIHAIAFSDKNRTDRAVHQYQPDNFKNSLRSRAIR